MKTYTKPSNVRDVIEKLQRMPPDLPVYTRSKYTGDTDYTKDYPVNINGISRMEAEDDGVQEEHVTILF